MAASLLSTAHDGAPDGAPFLVFHDRYGDLDTARDVGRALGDAVLRIAVRAPRLQTMGGSGKTRGHYWFIGPADRPELSTLGDGLYQLELLLLETFERHGNRKIGLLGTGEGGAIALLTALIWPEKLSAVIAIDAPLPTNLADMPLDPRLLSGLPILLVGDSTAAPHLTSLDARVTTSAHGPLAPQITTLLALA